MRPAAVADPPARPRLIGVEEAREAVLAEVRPLPPEPVALDDALGRVLAEPAISAEQVPPFDNSSMDGYAVRSADTASATPESPVRLTLAGESRAGLPVSESLGPGEAIAISTGAAVPKGADAVVRLEDTRTDGAGVDVVATAEPGARLRRAGDDIQRGDEVLPPGTVLGPAELGILASLGRPVIACRRRPTLAVLTTGDELRDPAERLAPGEIRDSSAYSVPALARLAGAAVSSVAHAADRPAETRETIESALHADVAVICGGVSVGSHDHVRGALAELGVSERFWGVALRPGKPTWFGAGEHGLAFGLPGNPVSAIVTFLLFVRPALLGLAGAADIRRRTTAALDEPYAKLPGRAHAVRCRMRLADDGWHVRPTGEQGSHVLTSMLGADCLAMIPADAASRAPGDRVEIEPLPRASLEAGT